MATNRKYGRVDTERGSLGVDEPVFILRYSDRFAGPMIEFYISLCHQFPGIPQEFLDDLPHLLDHIREWQTENTSLIKFPGRPA